MKSVSLTTGNGLARNRRTGEGPGTAKTTTSGGPDGGLPATHSPGVKPEAELLFAAVMASRSVQTPSSQAWSTGLLTVMVAALAEPPRAAANASAAKPRVALFGSTRPPRGPGRP